MNTNQPDSHMHHHLSRRRFAQFLNGRSNGQAIVIIAFVMIVLLGFTALAVDGGDLYLQRRKAQNAADAAVIAAVYDLCNDPNAPNPSSPANVATLTDPTTRTYDAIQDAILIAADNGFAITEPDVTFPDAPNYNHVLVTVSGVKQPYLSQVVYKGTLAYSAYAEGTCSQAHTNQTGMSMVGLGACSGGGGSHGIAYSGSDFTLTGGYSSNGDASFNGSAGHPAHISACPTGVTGSCTTDPAGTTVTGTNPATSDSKTIYNADPATTATGVTFPPFWKLADFQSPTGPVYYAANQLGKYHYANSSISSWTGFSGIASGGTNLTPGIYYVNGDVTFNAADMKNAKVTGVTLVASGTISVGLTGSDTNIWTLYQFPRLWPIDSPDGVHQAGDEMGIGVMPVIFAGGGPGACVSNASYGVNSSGAFSFLGVIYSPNGKCSLSFNTGGSTDGALICMQVDVSGSEYHLNYNPALLPPFDPTGGIAH
jgi:Flp pilus assembly protein TadG